MPRLGAAPLVRLGELLFLEPLNHMRGKPVRKYPEY
ncbi:hypothetical protein Y043_316 [Burkholderia pseudomallei MSHR2138]|nr:hypothetical protein Y043_316 [Burkholderia pseudomallei MSHR2138]KGX47776.1 hypothetical protein Y600_5927 [Burkholderia pseudomallei MSHR3709]